MLASFPVRYRGIASDTLATPRSVLSSARAQVLSEQVQSTVPAWSNGVRPQERNNHLRSGTEACRRACARSTAFVWGLRQLHVRIRSLELWPVRH